MSASIVINIFILKINSMENCSAINIGQSLLADWYNSSKRSQGFGQTYGDESAISGTASFVNDNDLIDSPSQKISGGPLHAKST